MIKYVVKEGLSNTYKNKLMSLASLGIVAASLIIFGIFFIITVNLNDNISNLKNQLEMEVFCVSDLEVAQINKIEEDIKKDDRIKESRKVTKEESLERMKKQLGEGQKVLEGLDMSFLPVSFVVKLKDPQDSQGVFASYKLLTGVEEVTYSQKAIDVITKLSNWIRIVSLLIIGVLLIVSVFIISNTIKLTVFARRKEINIMKFIGATDWFIRWPFIIEGIVIGIIGAIIALLVTGLGYGMLESWILKDMPAVGKSIFVFATTTGIGLRLAGIYFFIGIVIGMLGSIISLRKYLLV